MTRLPRGRLGLGTGAVLGLIAVMAAQFAVVGADTLWAVALGREILARGRVPDGVPFASLPTDGWPNVPALGEVALALSASSGPFGLRLLHVLCLVAALALLAWSATAEGAGGRATAAVLGVAAVGLLPVIGVVRMPVLSLVPYAAVLVLARGLVRAPGARRLWGIVAVLLVWGNLHGGVLVGLAVLGCVVIFEGRRLWRAVGWHLPAAVMAAPVAVLVATPSGLRTWRYYAGALTNEAARRRTELWSPPDLRSATGLLILVTAGLLVALALRSRRLGDWPTWELLAAAGLVLATVRAERQAVWLLLLLIAPAARGARTSRLAPDQAARRLPGGALLGCAVAAATVLVLASPQGRLPGVGPARQVVEAAPGRTILAPGALAEAVAEAGGEVVIGNPLDAFRPGDQAAYLDFLAGAPPDPRLLTTGPIVLTIRGSRLDQSLAADPRWRSVVEVEGYRGWEWAAPRT